MRTVVVTSGKPGSGVSSVAAALCGALARAGKKVFLAEMTAGRDAAGGTPWDLSDVLEGRRSAAEAAERVPGDGFFLLRGAERPGWIPRADAFRALLETIGGRCDFFVTDCPAGTGPLQKNLAAAATLLLLVVRPDRESVEEAARTGAWWEAAGLPEQKVIFNAVGRRLRRKSGLDNLDDALDYIGAPLLGLVPEGDARAESAAVRNLAGRLLGKRIPLLAFYQ